MAKKDNVKTQGADIKTPVSLESQARLMQIMNDSPTLKSFAGTEWEITALKPAVQHLIAEEGIKVQIKEDASMGDVLKSYASNFPSVCRVITLALLNDKDRIANEYKSVYETIMWESNQRDWAMLLSEILKMIDVSFFFATTKVIQMMRQMTTERKMTKTEAELS